jgi:hypothetical protein
MGVCSNSGTLTIFALDTRQSDSSKVLCTAEWTRRWMEKGRERSRAGRVCDYLYVVLIKRSRPYGMESSFGDRCHKLATDAKLVRRTSCRAPQSLPPRLDCKKQYCTGQVLRTPYLAACSIRRYARPPGRNVAAWVIDHSRAPRGVTLHGSTGDLILISTP